VRNLYLRLPYLALFVLLGAAAPAASPAPALLPTTSVVIDTDHGRVTFKTELAADAASRERGLMFRTKMAADAGMLFDFHVPEFENFWMKNTVLPLDLIFIRGNGTISSIAPNAVPYSLTTIPSAEAVRAVLEINGGRAAALGIEPDQHVHNAIFGNALPGQK
jgi:uncharacterized membrane protein (UPF0127 family)